MLAGNCVGVLKVNTPPGKPGYTEIKRVRTDGTGRMLKGQSLGGGEISFEGEKKIP